MIGFAAVVVTFFFLVGHGRLLLHLRHIFRTPAGAWEGDDLELVIFLGSGLAAGLVSLAVAGVNALRLRVRIASLASSVRIPVDVYDALAAEQVVEAIREAWAAERARPAVDERVVIARRRRIRSTGIAVVAATVAFLAASRYGAGSVRDAVCTISGLIVAVATLWIRLEYYALAHPDDVPEEEARGARERVREEIQKRSAVVADRILRRASAVVGGDNSRALEHLGALFALPLDPCPRRRHSRPAHEALLLGVLWLYE